MVLMRRELRTDPKSGRPVASRNLNLGYLRAKKGSQKSCLVPLVTSHLRGTGEAAKARDGVGCPAPETALSPSGSAPQVLLAWAGALAPPGLRAGWAGEPGTHFAVGKADEQE